MPDPTTSPLALRLRDATQEAHTAAERTQFVRNLFKGTLPRDSYVQLIRSLHAVYATMEAGMRSHRDDPVVAAMHDAALERAPALERDLEALAGPAWRALPVVPSATEYAAHLAAISAQAPHLLVAHGYVRYLGDLSGGQMIGKRLQSMYGFGDDGTHFYRFEQVPDVDAKKHAFRGALDRLPLAGRAADDLVDEAKLGFDYARRIFEELDAGRN